MSVAKPDLREKPHHPHWPLACLLFVFVTVLGLLSVHERATWLHIRSGETIAAQREIPGADSFSYTVSGKAWTTDSWLADTLFYAVHRRLGPKGLVSLKAVVAATAFVLLLPLNPASPLASAGVLSFGAVAAWSGLTELPAIFDLLLLSLLIRLLRPRRFEWPMVAQAAGIMALWANLHGATAALGLWIVGLKTFKASLRTEKKERIGHWALLGASLAGLATNPHGLAIIWQTLSALDATTVAWKPLSDYFNLYNFFCLVGAYCCTILLQREFFLTLTAATILGLSLLVGEIRALAILACCPVISLGLGHWIKSSVDLARVARLAAIMGLLALWQWFGVAVPLGRAGYGAASIEGALSFLDSYGVSGRVFNEIDSGAAMLGQSDRPVFVDGRLALYGPAFVRDAIGWQNRFESLAQVYGFDYALILNRRARYPARLLDESPRWLLVFADDSALVYLSREGANAALIKGRRPALLKPNQLWPDAMVPVLNRPKTRAVLLEEIDAWLAQSPDSVQALIWKAYALDRTGAGAKAQPLLRAAQSRLAQTRDPELTAALAFARSARGQTREALSLYRKAALIARRRADRRLEAEILARSAQTHREAGEHAQAAALERRVEALALQDLAEGR